MTFFDALKRRNVFRVGAAYLVVAWLVLQVIDVVAPILELPDALAKSALRLLAFLSSGRTSVRQSRAGRYRRQTRD